jgi:hypothetical protein
MWAVPCHSSWPATLAAARNTVLTCDSSTSDSSAGACAQGVRGAPPCTRCSGLHHSRVQLSWGPHLYNAVLVAGARRP